MGIKILTSLSFSNLYYMLKIQWMFRMQYILFLELCRLYGVLCRHLNFTFTMGIKTLISLSLFLISIMLKIQWVFEMKWILYISRTGALRQYLNFILTNGKLKLLPLFLYFKSTSFSFPVLFFKHFLQYLIVHSMLIICC